MSLRSARILPLVAALLVIAAAPAAAAGATIRWQRAVRVEPVRNGGLDAVACPNVRLCVTVDASGNVATTTNPTAVRRVWSRPVKIDRTALTGIACPTAKLCVATDANGGVLTSTNPTGGSHAWSRPVRVDTATGPDGGPAGLVAIACPRTTLCVAVDGATKGNVVATTHPLGGAGAWTTGTIGGVLTSVSCAGPAMCVVGGDQHYVATDPSGGAGAWHATGPQAGGGILSGIACPSLRLCVGVGYGNTSTGLATTSTNPRGGAAAWRTVSVHPTPPDPVDGLLDAVGCARGLCVALDSADNAFTTPAPASGVWTGPRPIRPKSASQTNAIACTGALCMVVDSAGVATAGTVRG